MHDELRQIFNIADKWVLITGASGFFGGYISRAFLEVGAKVILLSRSAKLSGQIKEYRREFGKDTVLGFRVDFYRRKELEDTLKKVAKKFDIDVVVNNAYDLSEKTGFNTTKGHLGNSTYNQWKSAFESGIYWAVLTTQIIGEQFKRKKKGSIINISSMYGVVSPNPKLYEGTNFSNPPTYGVNKAGIVALTRYTAAFWAKYSVRCNAVLPGPFSNVESERPNSVSSDDFFLERLKSSTVLNRIGHPNDLRGILIYLACDASSYMTGQAVVIDGGWTIT
jgi:NAD(P)-dependent dehydrogenase (short-subunit alcohol dehydrogenase family)